MRNVPETEPISSCSLSKSSSESTVSWSESNLCIDLDQLSETFSPVYSSTPRPGKKFRWKLCNLSPCPCYERKGLIQTSHLLFPTTSSINETRIQPKLWVPSLVKDWAQIFVHNCCKLSAKERKKKKIFSYKYLSKWQSFSPIGWSFLIPLVFSTITPFTVTSLCIPADLIRNSAGIPRFNFLPEHKGCLPSKSQECGPKAQLSTLVAWCLFILNDTLSILTWNS